MAFNRRLIQLAALEPGYIAGDLWQNGVITLSFHSSRFQIEKFKREAIQQLGILEISV